MRRSPPTAPGPTPPADGDAVAAGPRPYFLLVDDRFRVPIFVFVEVEPRRPARAVTIEFAPVGRGEHRCWVGVSPNTSLGRHPQHWDRFQEFRSDAHARAAGFLPIEPRYVGPSWESYLGAFRPEGERPPKLSVPRSAGR
jgi:hypothetical protein